MKKMYLLEILVAIVFFSVLLNYITLSYGQSNDPECNYANNPGLTGDCIFQCECDCNGTMVPSGEVNGTQSVLCKTYLKRCSSRRVGPVFPKDTEVIPFQPFHSGDQFYETNSTCTEPSGGACCCTECVESVIVPVCTSRDMWTGQCTSWGTEEQCITYVWRNQGDGDVHTVTNSWNCDYLPNTAGGYCDYCDYYDQIPEDSLGCDYREAYWRDYCYEWGTETEGPYGECLPIEPCPECGVEFICP